MASVDHALNPEAMEKLMKAAETPNEKLFIATAMILGMRRAEISHINKEWVQYQYDKIRIPESMPCTCYYCKDTGVWKPKTNTGARSIPLWHSWAKEVIKSYFSINDKVPVSERQVYNVIKKVAEKAKIQEKVYPHSLRATAATHFAEMGLNSQALCEVMGWKKLETAESYIRRLGKSAEKQLKEYSHRSLI